MKRFMTLVLFSAAMMGLQGCYFTHKTINTYGKASEKFASPLGPAYGNKTRIYVQGEKEVDPNLLFFRVRKFPAYMVFDVQDGKVINREVFEGTLPSVACEYPEIITLEYDMEVPFKDRPKREDVFRESKLEMAFISGDIFIQNSEHPNQHHIIWVRNYFNRQPRSTTCKISLPIVFTVALVTDIILFPAYAIIYVIAN